MVHEFIKEVKSTVKHWYLPLIVGVLFVGLGIWTIFSPMETYLGLAILFAIGFLVSGIFEIAFAITNRKNLDHWGWELANGIFSLLIGIILTSNPVMTLATLPLFIGFIVMFKSIMAISTSLELKKYGVIDWGNLMAFGILGLIFSFILIWNPVFAGLTIVVWTGIAVTTIGFYVIYYSFKLKKLHKLDKEIKKEINE